MKKAFSVSSVGVFFLVLFLNSLNTYSNAASAPDNPLKIGLTGKYPPFNYFNKEGELTGFDVDIAKKLCKKIDRKCEFVTLQWDGILASLLAGKIDLIIGSMAITPDREKQALFSTPYYESGAQIFAKNAEQDIWVPGFQIGVTLGTTYEAAIREKLPNAEIRTYKGDTEILQDIQAERLDAIVTDRLVGGYMIRNFGVDLSPIGEPLFLEKIGIPARPNEKILIGKINTALTSLRTSPIYDELVEKYFGLKNQTASNTFKWSTAVILLMKGLLWTTIISACGLCLGVVFAIFLAVMMIAAPSIFRISAKFFTDFFRSTPFLIQLLGIYFGLPAVGITIQPFQAAVITMALHSAAYLGEVLVSGFHAIPKEQRLASQLLGLSHWQAIRHIIFPQMLPIVTAPSLNTVVAMIKDSAIVSVISVYELTMQAQQLISSTYRPFEFYLLTAILYAAITYPLILQGRKLESRIQNRGAQL